jgi:hypothetical protein
MDVTVPYAQFVEAKVDLVGSPDGVRVGQQGCEGLDYSRLGLGPAEAVAPLRWVGQGVAALGQAAVGLRAMQTQGVFVQGRLRRERAALFRGAHRVGWDSIP